MKKGRGLTCYSHACFLVLLSCFAAAVARTAQAHCSCLLEKPFRGRAVPSASRCHLGRVDACLYPQSSRAH
eukprot:9409284-Pyramimonas_sp.AAC.1